MKHGNTGRTAALALTAVVTLGAGLLFAGPAGAIDRVGGVGCSTNGVTLFEGGGSSSVACYAGTANTIYDGVPGVGSVMGVWNHGYTSYYLPSGQRSTTDFWADGVHYKLASSDSDNYAVTIQS